MVAAVLLELAPPAEGIIGVDHTVGGADYCGNTTVSLLTVLSL
jgi:hypothetical protein